MMWQIDIIIKMLEKQVKHYIPQKLDLNVMNIVKMVLIDMTTNALCVSYLNINNVILIRSSGLPLVDVSLVDF